MNESNGQIAIYQSADGSVATEVRLEGDTVWLSQKQMAELFGKNIRTINEHIGNIFKEGELDESSVIRNFRITAADGKNYDTAHYNLDVIISVGYRVKSKQGTQFRIWAPNACASIWCRATRLTSSGLRRSRRRWTSSGRRSPCLPG